LEATDDGTTLTCSGRLEHAEKKEDRWKDKNMGQLEATDDGKTLTCSGRLGHVQTKEERWKAKPGWRRREEEGEETGGWATRREVNCNN
jgi:hypothetical protein